MRYEHILLATDLSYYSNQVASRAHDIASRMGAALSIIHVMEYTPVPYEGAYSADIGLREALEKKAKNKLAELSKLYDIPESNQHFASSAVEASISGMATQLLVDLIVIGSYTRLGLDALLGSHAKSILSTMKCDVLVVRLPPP